MLQLQKNLPPGGRNESVPSSGHIHEPIAVVVADDQRVDSMGAGKIATDDKLLTEIHSMFDPCTAALAGFVCAVLSLANNSLKTLFSR